MHKRTEPFLLFIPYGLDLEDQNEWIAQIIVELLNARILDSTDIPDWQIMLREILSVEYPEIAVASCLLWMPNGQPTYVWATIGDHPTNRSLELLSAVGSIASDPVGQTISLIDVRGTIVDAGVFFANQSDASGSDLVYMVGAVATTLSIPERGDYDACLWFVSSDLEHMPDVLPHLAWTLLEDEMAEFLSL